MPCLSLKKFGIFLILPFVLLQLQFAIALLHHHHNDSWYDHTDPNHHVYSHHLLLSKLTAQPGRPVFRPFGPALATTVTAVAAPTLTRVEQVHPRSCITWGDRPSLSLPKRAPPA